MLNNFISSDLLWSDDFSHFYSIFVPSLECTISGSSIFPFHWLQSKSSAENWKKIVRQSSQFKIQQGILKVSACPPIVCSIYRKTFAIRNETSIAWSIWGMYGVICEMKRNEINPSHALSETVVVKPELIVSHFLFHTYILQNVQEQLDSRHKAWSVRCIDKWSAGCSFRIYYYNSRNAPSIQFGYCDRCWKHCQRTGMRTLNAIHFPHSNLDMLFSKLSEGLQWCVSQMTTTEHCFMRRSFVVNSKKLDIQESDIFHNLFILNGIFWLFIFYISNWLWNSIFDSTIYTTIKMHVHRHDNLPVHSFINQTASPSSLSGSSLKLHKRDSYESGKFNLTSSGWTVNSAVQHFNFEFNFHAWKQNKMNDLCILMNFVESAQKTVGNFFNIFLFSLQKPTSIKFSIHWKLKRGEELLQRVPFSKQRYLIVSLAQIMLKFRQRRSSNQVSK